MLTGLHIEPTNLCTLKCEGCARTIFRKQWLKHWKNYSIDIVKLLQFLDINLNNMLIYLCGNYGDPIYHPKFYELVTELKARGAQLKITTNGSYKTTAWWKKLVAQLDKNDTIEFSIDGTPETFTNYRENGDWKSIKLGIDVATAASVRTIWKYIPFAFNANDIDNVAQLSIKMGFDGFLLDRSDRYEGELRDLAPDDENLIHPRAKGRVKALDGTADIDAKCDKGNMHYISADGYYSPCCFIADHRYYYKTPFGKNKNNYSIANTTISNILKQNDTVSFYKNIHLTKPLCCTMNCPRLKGTND